MAESIAEQKKKTIVPTQERGQPRIVDSSYFVQESKKTELKYPQILHTIDLMCEDDACLNSFDITSLYVLNSLYNAEWRGHTKKAEIAADFLNYCIRNLSFGSWLDVCNNANTSMKYGFSLMNIVTEARKYGPYKNSRVIKKLAPRDQKSVYAWIWDKNRRECLGFIQKPMITGGLPHPYLGNIGYNEVIHYEAKHPVLRNHQLLHFKFNSTNNNPQGNSPFRACYNAWKEKQLIEKLEVIACQKDMTGTIILRIPADLVEKANQPNLYPDAAAEYLQLQENAAALQNAENTFMVLTSNVDEASKKPLYDVSLLGLDGSAGKSYVTSDIIDQKRKSIYNVWGCGFLLLGQDSVGSYALSSSQVSTHAGFVNRAATYQKDVYETQLAPKILADNDIHLEWKDMPYLELHDPTEVDNDAMSKLIQRLASVQKLTPIALKTIYDSMGWDTEGTDALDFTSKGTSRAGEGVGGTSGTGEGSLANTSGSDNNLENTGNKSLIKDVTQDGKYLVDMDTGDIFENQNKVLK